MLLVRKSLLESERDALTTIINYNTTQNPDAQEAAVEMERDLQLNTTTKANENRTNAALNLMMECMRENGEASPPTTDSQCEELKRGMGKPCLPSLNRLTV